MTLFHLSCGCCEGTSLVPRPHPLTRRNGLVNQVEFLGLVHTFATVSPSNVQNILRHTKVKIFGYRDKKFYCCKGSETLSSIRLTPDRVLMAHVSGWRVCD